MKGEGTDRASPKKVSIARRSLADSELANATTVLLQIDTANSDPDTGRFASAHALGRDFGSILFYCPEARDQKDKMSTPVFWAALGIVEFKRLQGSTNTDRPHKFAGERLPEQMYSVLVTFANRKAEASCGIECPLLHLFVLGEFGPSPTLQSVDCTVRLSLCKGYFWRDRGENHESLVFLGDLPRFRFALSDGQRRSSGSIRCLSQLKSHESEKNSRSDCQIRDLNGYRSNYDSPGFPSWNAVLPQRPARAQRVKELHLVPHLSRNSVHSATSSLGRTYALTYSDSEPA